MRRNTIHDRVFYGWWIVIANSLITFLIAGTFFYSFGAFINPLKRQFDWSTAQISFAFSVRAIEAGPLGPVAGYCVDRFGSRIVMSFGVVLTGLGFLLLSRMNSLFDFYFAWIIMTVGTSACLGVTPLTNIANWFIRRRGRAMGFYFLSGGLSGLLVPVVVVLIDQYGWRITFLIIAVAIWAVCLPLALILRHRPEPYGLRPDGEPVSIGESPETYELEGPTTKEALKQRSFWLLSFTYLIFSIPLTSVTIFLIPYLTDSKEDNGLAFGGAIAGAAITILALSSLIGRYGFGWLGDYHSQRKILLWLTILQSIGLLVLASVDNLLQLIPFFILFGPAYGGFIVLRPVILATYFGRRCLGTIQGWVLAITTIGGTMSPVLVGILRDTTDGYRWPFFSLALIMLLCVPALLLLRHPPKFSDSTGPLGA